jgi:hypothetical protein
MQLAECVGDAMPVGFGLGSAAQGWRSSAGARVDAACRLMRPFAVEVIALRIFLDLDTATIARQLGSRPERGVPLGLIDANSHTCTSKTEAQVSEVSSWSFLLAGRVPVVRLGLAIAVAT